MNDSTQVKLGSGRASEHLISRRLLLLSRRRRRRRGIEALLDMRTSGSEGDEGLGCRIDGEKEVLGGEDYVG